MSIEAMKMALAALETCRIRSVSEWSVEDVTPKNITSAIEALRTAIQQTEAQQPATPEPVGFTYRTEIEYADFTGRNGSFWRVPPDLDDEVVPLYDHPAPSVPDDDFDLICNAIDKADTITMEGDYMLDSDDCIAVVRVMQVLLSVRDAMLAAK